MKTQGTEWEIISVKHISDKGLVSRIYKLLLKLNNSMTNDLVKIGKRNQRNYTDDQ